MRLLIVGLLLVGSVIVAQQRRDPVYPFQKMQRDTLLLDEPLGARSTDGVEVKYSANSVKQDGPVVRLEGRVRITTRGFILSADKAEYRPESGQIDAHGDVHVQVVRYPQKGGLLPSQNR